ncbi:unnamed protein product [Microthlaspi erraticum]|uniref:RING-type domain-containing protein n=1 Tax=Microthlaspi erraticum TaxID=1685480 RepID=A0A6D2K6X6_9BRAS|nr:unnamed protein product [Microthlaspi erraticum]
MEFPADCVSFNHEVNHNPKPEDAGRINVYASILRLEILDPTLNCSTVLVFSIPAKEYLDNLGRYRWDQLICLENEERLSHNFVDYGRSQLSRNTSNVIFFSGNYSPDCALSMYITFKTKPPITNEEYMERRRIRNEEEDSMYYFGPNEEEYMECRLIPDIDEDSMLHFGANGDEYMESRRIRDEEEDSMFYFGEDMQMQVSPDESTIDIRFRPASKFAVESLSRKVYKNLTSSFDMCTICLDDFKMGERVVTLPCGHEFDDGCILKWFTTSHDCPLCRFELPCEK